MNLELLVKYILSKLDQKKMSLSKTTLIKYIYLADYYYATENNGETFSKSEWTFINFGPFSKEVENEILRMKTKNVISCREFVDDNGSAGQIFNYSLKKPDEFSAFFSLYPEKPRILLGHAINSLGSDFHKILEFVYSETQPMIKCQPFENLDFSNLTSYDKPKKVEIKPLTGKTKKQALELLKKITNTSKESVSKIILNSKYDEYYFQAVGSDIFEPVELRGLVNFHPTRGKNK